MNLRTAGLVLASALVLGGATGLLSRTVAPDEPARPGGRSAGSSAPPEPHSADVTTFVVAPGAVGPARVGMTKAEAVATGFFEADVPPTTDGCQRQPLAWKPPYAEQVDVQTVGNGEIVSLGVRGRGPRTADGLGVGSTFAQVRAVADDPVPVEAGFEQAALFELDDYTGQWIGYLFAVSPDEVSDDDEVVFVEVTKGAQPSLVRSGC